MCFYFAFVSICVSFLLCLSSNLVECILLHQHVVPFKYSSHSFALFSLIRNMIDGSHFPFCCKSNTSEYIIRFTLFTIVLDDKKNNFHLLFKTQKRCQVGCLEGFKLFENIIQEGNFYSTFNMWFRYIQVLKNIASLYFRSPLKMAKLWKSYTVHMSLF